MSTQSSQDSTTAEVDLVRAEIGSHGQAHVLAFWDDLSSAQQQALLSQLEGLDLDRIDDLVQRFVRSDVAATVPGDLEPAPYYAADPAGSHDAEQYRRHGEALVAEGKVAAFTVAGGQGTRLGWNGPKGTFPATPVTGKPLFRVFAEQIIAAQRRYGVTIPWYLMTSPLNDADTRAFFQDNNYFGLNRANIFIFPQGTMPSLLLPDGKLMLADKSTLAVNPDGHGGSLIALRANGAIEDMKARGIEHISYFQVDNPLVNVIDPLFLGLHTAAPDSSAEVSSKMVAKAYPDEKVGVFCRSGDRTIVIEYSDLPDELASATDDDGQLRFNAGSIAIHMMAVDFVERLTEDAHSTGLPLHRAVKKVAYVDPDSGQRIEPTEPNAVKLEMFVFDALPIAESSIVLETRRATEFAPIKNAQGTDSPATSYQLQSNYYGQWLEQAGVTVDRDDDGNVSGRIEVSPLVADRPQQLASLDLPKRVAPGDEVAL